VVLSFDDNEAAEHFVTDPFLHFGGDVEGLFAKPTQFCGSGGCSTGRVKAFVRGKKFGWWVCSNCKKPTGVGTPSQMMRHVISQAVDLAPEAIQAPASVWTRGWGALGRG
jgi:hypothetical protein